MSRKHISSSAISQRQHLVGMLVQEWKEGQGENREPIIVTEGGTEKAPKHVYVVWDAWKDLNPRERSEIVMDAASQMLERDAVLQVTVAMGLTRDDARRMRLEELLGV